jgi:PAS domain S-box-containing protein
MVLRLRWATLVVTSYLILFGRGIHTPQLFPSLLILFYLASNLFAYFLPPPYFLKLRFFYLTLLFDTAMVSLGIYLTAQFNTDFYLVYFLIIVFASIARSFKLLMVNAVIICGIYGWFLWSKGLSTEEMAKGIILRIPFFFIMNLFYGFLIQSFEERTKRMRKEIQEVEESEERYRQIVESAHDAVAVLDEINRIKWFNGRLLQLTERSREELMGMELTKLMEGVDDEAIQKVMKGRARRKTQYSRGGCIQEEWREKESGSECRRFSLSNHKAYTIFYLKDIADREKMEDRLIRSEKLRALGEMAAGVAHDFNNVLGAILGRVQLIKLGLERTEDGIDAMPHEALQRELSVIEQAALDGPIRSRRFRSLRGKRGMSASSSLSI